MNNKKILNRRISIIGCGNLAYHLCAKFFELGFKEISVCNHKPNKNLNLIHKQFRFKVFSNFQNAEFNADMIFLCVPDSQIDKTAKFIGAKNEGALLVHCSGSTSIRALGASNNSAVFYPLQTFSTSSTANWKNIPILIEGTNEKSLLLIREIASLFSKKIFKINSEERMKIHLAAVFANNFSNALFQIAYDIIEENKKLKGNILLPLIEETINKLKHHNPKEVQTGPAKRGDEKVENDHLKLLTERAELQKLYNLFSERIKQNQHHSKKILKKKN